VPVRRPAPPLRTAQLHFGRDRLALAAWISLAVITVAAAAYALAPACCSRRASRRDDLLHFLGGGVSSHGSAQAVPLLRLGSSAPVSTGVRSGRSSRLRILPAKGAALGAPGQRRKANARIISGTSFAARLLVRAVAGRSRPHRGQRASVRRLSLTTRRSRWTPGIQLPCTMHSYATASTKRLATVHTSTALRPFYDGSTLTKRSGTPVHRHSLSVDTYKDDPYAGNWTDPRRCGCRHDHYRRPLPLRHPGRSAWSRCRPAGRSARVELRPAVPREPACSNRLGGRRLRISSPLA